MTFVTSDLHLGHTNIIKFANRPFKNVEEMNQTIIDNWNKVVGKKDTVFILGDLFYNYKENKKEILNQLNGTKILILGNHDKIHDLPIECFKSIHTALYIEINGIKYFLTHYPHCSWNGMYRNVVQLYGHVHNGSAEFEHPNVPNAYCVNLEFHNYTPINITEFKQVDFAREAKRLLLI